MSKEHYLSFFRRSGWLYYYCNQHGLFRQKTDRTVNVRE